MARIAGDFIDRGNFPQNAFWLGRAADSAYTGKARNEQEVSSLGRRFREKILYRQVLVSARRKHLCGLILISVLNISG